MRESRQARPSGNGLTLNKHGVEGPDPTPAARSDSAGRPLLLCFDGSPASAHAILVAGSLLRERTAIVLSVWQPTASLMSLDLIGDAVGRATGIYSEMDEIGAHVASCQSEDGVEIARRAGFDAQALTAEGKPWVEILRVAEARDVAAVVLGARGLTRLSPVAVGSVSTRVLHHSSRPVLVIPAAEQAGER